MATPAERAVIEAARALAVDKPGMLALDDFGDEGLTLRIALDTLDTIENPATGPAVLGVTYGQVVAGDKLQHRIHKTWHEVLENNVRDGSATFRLRGVAKPLTKPAGDDVQVQRSETGRAVDMFAAVMWSGPNGGTV